MLNGNETFRSFKKHEIFIRSAAKFILFELLAHDSTEHLASSVIARIFCRASFSFVRPSSCKSSFFIFSSCTARPRASRRWCACRLFRPSWGTVFRPQLQQPTTPTQLSVREQKNYSHDSSRFYVLNVLLSSVVCPLQWRCTFEETRYPNSNQIVWIDQRIARRKITDLRTGVLQTLGARLIYELLFWVHWAEWRKSFYWQ